MTPGESHGIERIADAFDRLTSAIHKKVKQNNRLMAGLAVVLIIQVVLVIGQSRVSRAVLDQSRKNQDHIDCVVGVLLRQDPPKCRGVKDQLIRDGIVPSGFPNTTTTRSTTP